jgi:uncharacterized DUF497 family protein
LVDWQRFDVTEWDIEFEEEKLSEHGVMEAAEVLWNGFEVRRNKKHYGRDRYQLISRTDAGRVLRLIVHVRGTRSMRVITGWPI